MDKNKDIIGYIVETTPNVEYGMLNHDRRIIFPNKNLAYRYIIKLVEMIEKSYKKIIDSGYESLYYKDFESMEIDEEQSVPLDMDCIYETDVRCVNRLGYERVNVYLNRKHEVDKETIDMINPFPVAEESDGPEYFSEPIREVTINVIPICMMHKDTILKALELTAIDEDVQKFILKNSTVTIKMPGESFMEFKYYMGKEDADNE